ncbi:phosphocholine cytidylyltransferase family protein [Thermophagus sp. OGC60D27]|uniref:phosphocholine cytidylyltransferase family protein n=1 Tax=Thermophagus sp. OGC60D27 TaxID=3458415 RepID=UPI0040380897
MKIVILAAGLGSRLGNPLPKPLTTLKNGKSIMQLQIDNISACFDINDIITVVGFKKEVVMETFPTSLYVYNPQYDQTNTSKSLLIALKKAKNESVLWMNGDVVFDAKLFDAILPHIKNNTSFICVNNEECGDEEVKYRTDNNGFVTALSKTVKDGEGEAVGINFISSSDIPTFIRRLEEVDDNDYFEAGIELMIKKDKVNILPVDISAFNCMEVDFKEDLDNANKML